MKLFINTTQEATTSLTNALDDQSVTSVNPLFYGDNLPLEITLHNGAGGFDENYDQAEITIAVGNIAQDEVYIEKAKTLDANSQKVTTQLDLRGQEFDDLTAGVEAVNAILEIQAKTGTISRTIHQSTIQVRNQLLDQQTIVLTTPAAPSEIVITSLPVPDAPSQVVVQSTPAAPSQVTAAAATIPDAPSQVTAGVLPNAPSNVTAATAMQADAISEVYAYEVAAWSFSGVTKYSPLKIRVEETSPGSMDGTSVELLKGKTFIWDGVEVWEPNHHFAGASYTGAPVWRAGGEEPGSVETPSNMTAQRAWDLQLFRILLTDPGGSSPGWMIQYARPENNWEGGYIGQTGLGFDDQRKDPAYANTSAFNLRPLENEPIAPSNITTQEVLTIPAAPSQVVVDQPPAAPSQVEVTKMCYDQDPTGVVQLGKLAICIEPFGLAPAPNSNYATTGELFRVDLIGTGNTPIKLVSMSRNAYSHVSNQTSGSKARGISWQLLKTESCDTIQNIDLVVTNHGAANGYYQIINPNYGFYTTSQTGQSRFQGSQVSNSGASLYYRLKYLDCTDDLNGYYIYRHQWTGSDYIVQDWRASQVVVVTSSGGLPSGVINLGTAGAGGSSVTALSGISTATGTECQVTGAYIGELRKVTGTWENGGKTTIVDEILEIEFITASGDIRYKRSDGIKLWSSNQQYLNKTEAYTAP